MYCSYIYNWLIYSFNWGPVTHSKKEIWCLKRNGWKKTTSVGKKKQMVLCHILLSYYYLLFQHPFWVFFYMSPCEKKQMPFKAFSKSTHIISNQINYRSLFITHNSNQIGPMLQSYEKREIYISSPMQIKKKRTQRDTHTHTKKYPSIYKAFRDQTRYDINMNHDHLLKKWKERRHFIYISHNFFFFALHTFLQWHTQHTNQGQERFFTRKKND